MTTIAYRDGVVAADSRNFIGGWKQPYPAQKLFRMKDGSVCAVTGDYAVSVSLVRWLETDRTEDQPNLGEGGSVLHFRKGGEIDVYEMSSFFTVKPEFGAWGSGSPAANAAMFVGADAAKAVEAAAFVDDGTGGEIITMQVEE